MPLNFDDSVEVTRSGGIGQYSIQWRGEPTSAVCIESQSAYFQLKRWTISWELGEGLEWRRAPLTSFYRPFSHFLPTFFFLTRFDFVFGRFRRRYFFSLSLWSHRRENGQSVGARSVVELECRDSTRPRVQPFVFFHRSALQPLGGVHSLCVSLSASKLPEMFQGPF